MPWLSDGTTAHQLHDGEVIVGSGSEADWRVASADLMPRHFLLLVHGLNASIRPMNTENVVVVNGQQLSGAPLTLHDGDVIAAGSGRFVYTDDAPRVTPTRAADQSRDRVAYLVDDRASTAYRLASRSTGIGRDQSNAVVIRDPTASRFHAEIRREAGGFVLHARGSAGTAVNDRRVAGPWMLEEGDRIEIAYTVLRFTADRPADAQLAAVRPDPGHSSQSAPTPISAGMTIESAIVAPPARGRTALLAAIALLVALAIWLWLR
jgi:pSer/pThr/pTyr-binding forkhead associated (FHA) protein